MLVTFLKRLPCDRPDEQVEVFNVSVAEHELGVFQRWPNLQRRAIKFAHPSATPWHSTSIAVVTAPNRRALVPVIWKMNEKTFTASPEFEVMLNHVIAEDKAESSLAAFLSTVDFELRRSILNRLISKVSPRLRRRRPWNRSSL